MFLYLLLAVVIGVPILGTADTQLASSFDSSTGPRIIPLRLIDELACPYAAAVLIHKSLHMKIRHWMNVWKMEEVFFNTLVK